MLKLAGCLILFCCSCIYGSILSSKAKKELEITEALAALVAHIGASIKTQRLPLSEIFGSVKSTPLEDCGFTDVLISKGVTEAAEHIRELIPKDAYEALYSLGKSLGGIDADDQVALCDYTEKRLRKEAEKLKNAYPQKVRMCWALPVLGALSIIIIIL